MGKINNSLFVKGGLGMCFNLSTQVRTSYFCAFRRLDVKMISPYFTESAAGGETSETDTKRKINTGGIRRLRSRVLKSEDAAVSVKAEMHERSITDAQTSAGETGRSGETHCIGCIAATL